MCLVMCLKKQEFQADCVYKLGVYDELPKVMGQGTSKMAIFKKHFSHDIFIQLSLLMSKMTILALL